MIDALFAILSATRADTGSALPVCTPQQVIEGGRVSTLKPQTSTFGLDLQAKGLEITHVEEVIWPECSPKFQEKIHGDSLITESGIKITSIDNHLTASQYKFYESEPEPAHPKILKSVFKNSVRLSIGNQRIGVWSRSDTTFLIARYLPGQTDRPIPLFISKAPVVGLFYLPAPDFPGGSFRLWQRLSMNKYRFIIIGWSEEGLR